MPEVIKNTEELFFVNNDNINEVKDEAQKSSKHLARLLMHLSHEDLVQEMLIAMSSGCLVMPNRAIGHSESLQLLGGELLLVIFDDFGRIIQRVKMGQIGSDNPYMYRFNSTPWHTMIPLSEIVVVHEIIQGPFKNSSEKQPEWLPKNTDEHTDFISQCLNS